MSDPGPDKESQTIGAAIAAGSGLGASLGGAPGAVVGGIAGAVVGGLISIFRS